MPQLDFETFSLPAPDYPEVREEYERLRADLAAAGTPADYLHMIGRWDNLRRRLETWQAVAEIRFEQDTRNPDYKQNREYLDEIRPRLTDLQVDFMQRLLSHSQRPALDAEYGPQAAAVWEKQIAAFDPVIQQDLVQESKLESEYTQLTASAEFEFDGETLNLSSIVKYRQHGDREKRHAAERLRWGWFAENRETLDAQYDGLVKLRTEIGRKLGHANFVPVGYERMARIGYGRPEVERWREQILEHIIPLANVLKQRQAERLGLDQLMYWDDAVADPQGNPHPQGDEPWMVERAQSMFAELDAGLAAFFQHMRDAKLLDLSIRPGKAPGGFCAGLPTLGTPFVFANFNGTKGDVEVFTHEMGHAYQNYASRMQPLVDYLWPTTEACEVHSLGLEFLTWPWMERFFEDDADRFRRIHLEQSLLFLPYGAAIDHFQHLVYDRPDASPAERHGFWKETESRYLPWRDYGDLEHCQAGGFWQCQRHIYVVPFYYIDYTLALACAMQFWILAEENRTQAMRSYLDLCRRGGSQSFTELVEAAGLRSPFDPAVLPELVARARDLLEA